MKFQGSRTRNLMNWATAMLVVLLFLALPLFAQESNGASEAVPDDVKKQLEALTKRVEQVEEQLREHESARQPTTVVPSARASAPAQAYAAPVEAAARANTNKTITDCLVMALIFATGPSCAPQQEVDPAIHPGVAVRLKVQFGDVPEAQTEG